MDEPFNPYRTQTSAPEHLPPNPGTPKTIGTLNIVFACGLLLCGACYTVEVIALSMMQPMMGVQHQQMQSAIQAQRQQEIDDLKAQEELAGTEEEKAALAKKRWALEAQPVPKMPDVTAMWGLRDKRVTMFYMVDAVSGVFLNLAMLMSGIGLVRLYEWGRVLAIWLSALKVVRLAMVYLFAMIVVVPTMSKQWMDVMKESMPPGGQGAPGPDEMATMATAFGTSMTVFLVLMIVVGSIYPLICLWVLTRPGVKAACTGGAEGG